MKKLLLIFSFLTFQLNIAQNNAYTFNSVDQWVQTYSGQANIRFTTQNFTFEAWVKPNVIKLSFFCHFDDRINPISCSRYLISPIVEMTNIH